MKRNLVSLCLALPLIAACSGGEVKSALGLKKHSPDEFMVLSRPALTVPPSFDLPEPTAPSVTPQSQAVVQAKSAVLGNGAAPAASAGTNAESAFLEKAGAANASSAIRLQLDQDARDAAATYLAADPAEEKGFFGRMFSPITLDSNPDPIVNPEAEKERIKQQIEDGGEVTGEDVPTIQPKGESVIDKIF